jgi:hypothetical protein
MTVTIDWGGDENQLSDGDEDPYGRDLEGTDVRCILQALYRRYTTERGGLWYDASYGENILSYLSDASTPLGRERLRTRIVQQALQDERVDTADATLVYNDSTETLTIEMSCTSALGPFSLVMSVDQAAITLVTTESSG